MRSSEPVERAAHGRSALQALFPGTAIIDGDGPTRSPTDRFRTFALVPGARHPRLLVPVSPHAGAGAALRAYGGRLNRRANLGYRGLAAVLGVSGVSRYPGRLSVVPDADSSKPGIDEHLRAIIGESIAVAIHLTPARANRKPIVQALQQRHRYPVAFAKVATSPLTARLVDQEATALTRLAGCDTGDLILPAVLDRGDFNGTNALVMRPLPTWSRGRLPNDEELMRASTDLARTADAVTTSLAASAYWTRIRTDIEAVEATAKRDALRSTADRVESFAGDTELTVGPSHGDWSPWNMWKTKDGLLVWDWERFATDVPVGSDLAHYRLQEMLVMRGAQPLDAARAVVDEAPSRLIAALHLLSLAVRYDKDDQASAGATIKPSDEWLLPVVNEVARPAHSAGRVA